MFSPASPHFASVMNPFAPTTGPEPETLRQYESWMAEGEGVLIVVGSVTYYIVSRDSRAILYGRRAF